MHGNACNRDGTMATGRDRRATYEVYMSNPPGGPMQVVRTVGGRRMSYTIPVRGLLTIPEAAAVLRKTRVTLYRWMVAKPPKIKVTRTKEGRQLIPASEIRRILEAERNSQRRGPSVFPEPAEPGDVIIGTNPVLGMPDPLTRGIAEVVFPPDTIVEGKRGGTIVIRRSSGRPLTWRIRRPPKAVGNFAALEIVDSSGRVVAHESKKGGEKRVSKDQPAARRGKRGALRTPRRRGRHPR